MFYGNVGAVTIGGFPGAYWEIHPFTDRGIISTRCYFGSYNITQAIDEFGENGAKTDQDSGTLLLGDDGECVAVR
ncbi:MAG TPA: hypothetical protein VFU38_09945, partial [Candidatus Krumholzibacteria bacterium]|nr:hypothetical protein [Candidatus Krumholzibacteria bacterium]